MSSPLALARRSYPAMLLAGLLILSGCDTLAEDVVLSPREAVFRFEFTSQQLQSGQPIASENTVTIDLDGFSADEVLSASVTSAELSRILPLNVDLSFLSDASVALTAGGLSARTVASRSGFPAASDATLSPSSGTDVGAYVGRSGLGAQLVLDPASVRPNEEYELWVTLTFRVTVEGV